MWLPNGRFVPCSLRVLIYFVFSIALQHFWAALAAICLLLCFSWVLLLFATLLHQGEKGGLMLLLSFQALRYNGELRSLQ